MSKQILRYKRKIEHQLYNNLLPFWEKLKDDKNGGFFGYVDSKGNIDFLANKGAMLQIR
ncbi:MAG: N-acylglucosamine 2-epimerase, partial [Acholeplasmataceae bacterium]|nr:N-acylglucosamine 2-epimerase [Acholeplasmataceae bacterium]